MRREVSDEASIDHSLYSFAQLVNAKGLKLLGSEWFLPGLGTGMTTDGGKQPDSQMWLWCTRTDKSEFG